MVFFQGCPHGCPKCHNPETHDENGGTESDTQAIIDEIRSDKYIDGITLSGGDPFLQPGAALSIAEAAKEAGLDVWAYSGWTYEELISEGSSKAAIKPPEGAAELLKAVDVLVDGRYVDSLHVGDDEAADYLYRGSKNQRLIDVAKSIEAGKAVDFNG